MEQLVTPDAATTARLQESFNDLTDSRGWLRSIAEYDVLVNHAVRYYKQQMKSDDVKCKLRVNQDCVAKTLLELELEKTFKFAIANNAVAVYFSYSLSICRGERDINCLTVAHPNGGRKPSRQTLRDTVAIRGYGPTQVQELCSALQSSSNTFYHAISQLSARSTLASRRSPQPYDDQARNVSTSSSARRSSMPCPGARLPLLATAKSIAAVASGDSCAKATYVTMQGPVRTVSTRLDATFSASPGGSLVESLSLGLPSASSLANQPSALLPLVYHCSDDARLAFGEPDAAALRAELAECKRNLLHLKKSVAETQRRIEQERQASQANL